MNKIITNFFYKLTRFGNKSLLLFWRDTCFAKQIITNKQTNKALHGHHFINVT